jgi:hypothetical protein
VPGVISQSGLELLPVLAEVPVDLVVGHADAQGHLPAHHLAHLDVVAQPLANRVVADALGLDALLELVEVLDVALLDPLEQLLVDLGLVH